MELNLNLCKVALSQELLDVHLEKLEKRGYTTSTSAAQHDVWKLSWVQMPKIPEAPNPEDN